MLEVLWQVLSIFTSVAFWIEVAVFTIIVLSLNLEYGWTGIPNFGKVAFVSMGGLAAALVLNYIIVPMLAGLANQPGVPPEAAEHAKAIEEILRQGRAPGDYYYVLMITQHVVPLFQMYPQYYFLLLGLSLLAAVALGAIFALIVSYPIVRLREDYLAIVLLMTSFLLWMLYTYFPLLMGGTFGILIQTGAFTTIFGDYAGYARLAVVGVAALLSILLAERLLNTPFGRMLRAIRDDEAAAEAMGKDAARTRLTVIMLSSVWAALGGVLYVLVYVGSIHPDYYRIDFTFLWIAMLLLGGVGNNIGAVIGVIAFDFFYNASQVLVSYILQGMGLPLDIAQGIQGLVANMLVGVILVLILFFRPQGIIPEKPVKTPIWRVFVERTGVTPEFLQPFYARIARIFGKAGQRGKRSSRVG
ncbi:inner-membrane translocator [Pyrolobus fumarii 1A]|uniref:Inner-membrane translocator n=2 Tax=Pyrolobus fumarii TaxID=54252 RepID=G0ED37_PYRF1|nr:inner-membrane translocator [Pyrolobus fumarii 1A]